MADGGTADTLVQFNDFQEASPRTTPMPAPARSVRSTTKSRAPDAFHGHPSDQGHKAQAWLYGLNLYFTAENDPNPVARAATYLCSNA